MEIKFNRVYLMMNGVSYGQMRDHGLFDTPMNDADQPSFYYTHNHQLVMFTKIEKVNELFEKYYFVPANQPDNTEGHFLLFCSDDEYYSKIPDILLKERFSREVTKAYPKSQLQYIVYNPSEKYLKLRKHIEKISNDNMHLMGVLNSILRDEAVDSKGLSIDSEIYDNDINEYLQQKLKRHERPKRSKRERSDTPTAGLSEPVRIQEESGRETTGIENLE